MHVLVTGASGLIGTALTARLAAGGHHVSTLGRSASNAANRNGGNDHRWDPAAGQLPDAALDGVDAVVHLAGAGIGDHRWTDEYKGQLVDSRVRSTELLAAAIACRAERPSVWLSGSAIGAYGDRGDEQLTEQSAPGSGFLADLVARWEAATAAAGDAGVRVAHLRSGIVLSPTGGALRKQLPLFKLCLGGRFGSGRQWQSWISIDDEVAAIEHLLTADVHGPVNLTSPNPVTNAEFTRTLAGVLGRPAIVPVPRFGPSMLLGAELTENLLFHSQRVLPAKLTASGFEHRHPVLGPALRALLAR